jgi:hypothetical protein
MKEFLKIIGAILGVFTATFLVLKFLPVAVPGLVLIIVVLANILIRCDLDDEGVNNDNK